MSDAYGAGAMDSAKAAVPDAGSGGGGFDISGGGAAALGAGALGIGGMAYMLGKGPPGLPPQAQQAGAMVPGLQAAGAQTYGQGQTLVNQATKAYDMAQRGELTDPQKAQLAQADQQLQNAARQTFASMGRDMTKDTSGIATQMNITQADMAMSQSFVQSTIALAGSMMGAGNQLIGESLQFDTAASNILMQEAQMQVQLDKQYSDQMAAAFKAVGTIVGGVAGAFVGGPAGAMLGASLGGGLGTLGAKAAA